MSMTANDIDICFRDAFTKHGEELVRSLDGESIPNHALLWPNIADDLSALRSREQPLVARIDGVVVARAFFEAELYPFAELQNLYVAPEYRGKGVGTRIVADIVKRAAELGYLAIHIQTHLDNMTAQKLYLRHGFIPAQQGKMLRMIRFINLPLLSSFLSAHPLVRFDSRAIEGDDRRWLLEWSSLTNTDKLAIHVAGGSCQAENNGFAPGVVGSNSHA